jgi:hypothetical protein
MSASTALAALRSQSLAVAEKFADYNFRSYFVKHTADKFDAFNGKPDADVTAFVQGEGKANLAQLERMVTINGMFTHVPVIVDERRSKE